MRAIGRWGVGGKGRKHPSKYGKGPPPPLCDKTQTNVVLSLTYKNFLVSSGLGLSGQDLWPAHSHLPLSDHTFPHSPLRLVGGSNLSGL